MSNRPARYNTPMKPSIFVVEDDPDISRLVRHHLEADGFAVKVFSTGNTVIADSERQRPALFILDIMVPGKMAWSCAGRSGKFRRWRPRQSSF